MDVTKTENVDTIDTEVTVDEQEQPRKKRRFKKGTVSLRQIKKYQNSTDLLLPRASFRRLVNEITEDLFSGKGIRYSTKSILAIQEASEVHATEMLKKANNNCIRSGRKTILKRDIFIDE